MVSYIQVSLFLATTLFYLLFTLQDDIKTEVKKRYDQEKTEKLTLLEAKTNSTLKSIEVAYATKVSASKTSFILVIACCSMVIVLIISDLVKLLTKKLTRKKKPEKPSFSIKQAMTREDDSNYKILYEVSKLNIKIAKGLKSMQLSKIEE